MKSNRVFDSMKAASSALGMSVDALRAIKGAGCSAFKGSRVHEKPLLDWISEHPEATSADPETRPLKDQKIAEEIRKLRIANDTKEKKLIERAKVCASIERLANRITPMLEAKLEREYPQAIASSPEDIARCRIFGANLNDAVRREFAAFHEEWK